MAKKVQVNQLGCTGIEEQEIEIVERKGLGHPDSIMDGMMEEVSRELSKYYIKNFGRILHHNTDKGQLSSGNSNPCFGGGKILRPIHVLLSGQATDKYGGDDIAVEEIAIKAARKYLVHAVPRIDIDCDAIFDSKIVMGSSDLVSVYERKEEVANDTSFGVGYAPLSATEMLVLDVEKYLNSHDCKKKHPAVGTDVKVMALRLNGKITLTVAAAMVSSEVKDVRDYVKIKESVLDDLMRFCSEKTELPVDICLNRLDKPEKGDVYITVIGTSAEKGDAGAVGRGNRVNGLITPCRPMSLEAAAGKNPQRHIGKLYNVMARLASEKIVKEIPSIKEIHIKLLSQIGRPISDPLVAEIRMDSEDFDSDTKKAGEILEGLLHEFPALTKSIVEGKVGVF